MRTALKNIKGLYIGDISYALKEDAYDVWEENDYEDGTYETEDGKQFAVSGTRYGDGYYTAYGFEYSVDAGAIGVVDLSIATGTEMRYLKKLGMVIPDADKVIFDVEDYVFEITVYYNGKVVYKTRINTNFEGI